MDKRHIYGKDEHGNELVYDVILTFHNDNNNQDYIVYTNNEVDSKGKLKVYSSIYNHELRKTFILISILNPY